MNEYRRPVRFAQLDRQRIRDLVGQLACIDETTSTSGQQARLCDSELKAAAVALVLCPNDRGDTSFVLTRRSSALRSHAGQWALPGGRLDAGENSVDAALRELKEEVGVDIEGRNVLGELDSFVTRSGFSISPVVCWCPEVPSFVPNPAEVDSIHLVPLAEFDTPKVPELRSIPESERLVLSLPLFGQHLHAPTAAIVYQFFELVFKENLIRVAHYEQPVFAWK